MDRIGALGRSHAGPPMGAVLVAVGLALVVLYFAHVGELGEPTDIGGLFVLLAGWLLAGAGVSLFVVRLLARRDARRTRLDNREHDRI